MLHNFAGENINSVLPKLLDGLLHYGTEMDSRVNRCKELAFTDVMLRDPWHREILLPGRKANIAAQIAESMWVLAGRNDIEWLSHYLPRAADFSDDGVVWRAGYGPRLRAFDGGNETVDQLAEVIRLLREDTTTRRAVMSIFDPLEDYQDSKDIPCNNWLHFLCRDDQLHLHVAIRSNDAMWGWSGANAFVWSVLLEVVAGLVGVRMGHLHFSVSSMHLYEPHWEKAHKIAGGERVRYSHLFDSPRFAWMGGTLADFDRLVFQWFEIEANIRNVNNTWSKEQVEAFPEPMLRSWLRVLQWWWSGDQKYLEPLKGTRLAESCRVSLQPKASITTPTLGARVIPAPAAPAAPAPSAFVDYVTELHVEKHAAYGDSWKRRGEMLGIMANLARKVDRLGANGGGDTAADTAVDLMVYLAKYRWWLVDHQGAPLPAVVETTQPYSAGTDAPNQLLRELDRKYQRVWHDGSRYRKNEPADLEAELTEAFTLLEELVTKGHARHGHVDEMLQDSYVLARQLWESGTSGA